MYFLLTYDYVVDILTEREPFRAEHLSILQEYQDRGELLLAGAVGDPVAGAAFVFKVATAADVQAFVDRDPYMANELVTRASITSWNVVAGSAHQEQ